MSESEFIAHVCIGIAIESSWSSIYYCLLLYYPSYRELIIYTDSRPIRAAIPYPAGISGFAQELYSVFSKYTDEVA